jgi:hypothetical protein
VPMSSAGTRRIRYLRRHPLWMKVGGESDQSSFPISSHLGVGSDSFFLPLRGWWKKEVDSSLTKICAIGKFGSSGEHP